LASHSEIGDFGNRHGTLEPRHYCLSQVFCEAMPDSRLTRLDKLRWPSSQFCSTDPSTTPRKKLLTRKFRRLLAGRSSQAAEQAAVQPLGSAGQCTLSVRGARGRWPDSPRVTGMCEHFRSPVISKSPRTRGSRMRTSPTTSTLYIYALLLALPCNQAEQFISDLQWLERSATSGALRAPLQACCAVQIIAFFNQIKLRGSCIAALQHFRSSWRMMLGKRSN
jgi:hypothetical protein